MLRPPSSQSVNPRTPGGNAVFPLKKARRRRRSVVLCRTLKARFKEVDKDRNGMLDESELGELLRLGNPRIKDEDVRAIFRLVDRDDSGKVDFEEFVDFLFMPQDAQEASSSSSATSDDESSDSSEKSEKSAPSGFHSGRSSDSETLARAAKNARQISASFGHDLSELVLDDELEADHIKVSGACLVAGVNGHYRRREPDWVVLASNCSNEASFNSLNGRPFYVQEASGKAEQGSKKGSQHFLFYGWTTHWGRWGGAGWFISQRLPEDQQPVEEYLLFCPWADAETPDLCRAAWVTRNGRRDKRALCEAAMAPQSPQRRSKRGGKGKFLDEELWEARRGSTAGLEDADAEWEWRAESGEDSWDEHQAVPAEEWGPPPRMLPEVAKPAEGPADGEKEEEERRAAAAALAAAEEAAAAAAAMARHRRASEQLHRAQVRPRPRRLSEDTTVKHAPGFNVISKQDHRNAWFEKRRLEDERRRASLASDLSLQERVAEERAREDEIRELAKEKAGQKEQEEDKRKGAARKRTSPWERLLGKSSVLVDGWERLPLMHNKPKLFTSILPDDVLCEASAGNRWFLCACAAVAEYPAWVQTVFGHTARLSPQGCYCVRLYHPGRQMFVHVTINDHVPTRGGSPAFAGIACEGDLWVALLEKAFAKFCGSYASTEKGTAAYGLLYLCGGGGAESWQRQEDKVWRRAYTQWAGKEDGEQVERRGAEAMVDDGREHDEEEVWEVLRRCRVLCRPVLCSVDRKACNKACGLFADRPYSLLAACDVPVGGAGTGVMLRMVQLRNLFGAEGWRGRWGSNSEAWEEHPALKAQLQERSPLEDDGGFWMSYSDFLRHFDGIDFVAKSMPVQGCCHAIREGGDWRLSKVVARRKSSRGSR